MEKTEEESTGQPHTEAQRLSEPVAIHRALPILGGIEDG